MINKKAKLIAGILIILFIIVWVFSISYDDKQEITQDSWYSEIEETRRKLEDYKQSMIQQLKLVNEEIENIDVKIIQLNMLYVEKRCQDWIDYWKYNCKGLVMNQ